MPNSTTTRRDPWAKLEAWRKHAIFSRSAQFRGAFPGLGIATVAFAAYCGIEWAMNNNKEKHH
jgi:NADH dehydrogenase (ubiquinone) 1 beta subcomplex subunit 3